MAPRGKPSDHFTRFTSATPHASSFTSSGPSSSNPSTAKPRQSGPPGETPGQKVARLRAAHRAAQEAANFTTMDRIVGTGRIIADKVHRGAAYTLMGFTVVAGGLALYSGVSLIRHHRRQRRAWIDRELERLRDAQTAFLRGEATAEQLHLLEQERAGEELKIQHEEERRKQKANSLWGKTKRALYSLGGVDVDETELSIGEKLREQAPYKGIMDMVREKELEGKRLLNEGKGLQNAQKPPSVTEPFQQPRTDTNAQGGLLDQLAQNSASAVTNQTKSWFGWASRKS